MWACIIIALVLAHHALAVFLRGTAAKVFSYVNIALHIFLVGILFYTGAELSELLLIFMGSLLFRVALEYLNARVAMRDSKPSGEEGSV